MKKISLKIPSKRLSLGNLLKKVGKATLPSFFLFFVYIVSVQADNSYPPIENGKSEFQEITVKGIVTDARDGQPLPGVNIFVKGTSKGTISNISGEYSINVFSSDAILVFSFIGYLTEEVVVGDQTTINFTMIEDIKSLEEVVVIGYGEQSRQMLSSSISSVKANEIEDLQVTTIENALQGKAAGVSILTSSGQPGSTPTVRIRGGSSISRSNDPLYIIDGVQRSSEDFNPEDVASIEVLKDAAATAIYGARASNGVILITTKQGTKGKARFNASFRTSANDVTKKLDLLNAEDFLRIERVGLTRSYLNENSSYGTGATATGTGNAVNGPISTRLLADGESVPAGYKSMIDPVTGETIIFQDIDWQDEVYRTSLTNNYNLSVDGGTESLTYYLGTSYLDQEGIAEGTNYERFSVQSNVNFDVNDKLKIKTNVNFTKSASNEPYSTSTIFGRAARQAPTVKKYLDDGTLSPGVRSNLPNPLFYIDNYLNDESINKLGLGAILEYRVLPDLIAKVYGNYYLGQTFREAFIKANTFTSTRSASSRLNEKRQSQVEATLNYVKSFGDNNLSFLLGTSRVDGRWFNSYISASGGSTDNIHTLNAAPNISSYYTDRERDLLISVFSRLNYDYKGKYILAATVRRDGSSRFGSKNNIGYFPSFSAAWRISDEPFFNVSSISGLKLRASWGQTGNNDVDPSDTEYKGLYTAQGVVNPGLVYAGESASSATAIANTELGWEATSQTDIGMDIDLFNDRLIFSADYYDRTTSQLLFSTPLPNTSGFSSITENIGKVKYSGAEFLVSAKIIRKNDFSWTTDFNIAYSTNKVLELPENGLDKNRIGGLIYSDGYTGVGGIAEGEKLGNIVGYEFVKVYATTDEAQADGLFDEIANNRTSSNGIDYRYKVGGDVKWKDYTDDNIINRDDQVVIGNITPDFTGGLANQFTYKNIDLYVFMDFAIGHRIYNYHRVRMNSNSQGNINGTSDLLDAWNEEGDETDVPRFVFYDLGNARNFHRPHTTLSGGGTEGGSSQYIEKGDYLCLRTVRLSYNLPTTLLSKVGITSAKVYAAAQNLHTFTKYTGYNPEVEDIDEGLYPLYRTLSLGINFGF